MCMFEYTIYTCSSTIRNNENLWESIQSYFVQQGKVLFDETDGQCATASPLPARNGSKASQLNLYSLSKPIISLSAAADASWCLLLLVVGVCRRCALHTSTKDNCALRPHARLTIFKPYSPRDFPAAGFSQGRDATASPRHPPKKYDSQSPVDVCQLSMGYNF